MSLNLADCKYKVQNMSFVCMCLVVFIHLTLADDIRSKFYYSIIRYVFAPIAVPWFFVLSGLFIAKNVDNDSWYKNALQKRFYTLVIPYCIWCALYVLFRCLLVLIASLVHSRAPTATEFSGFISIESFGLYIFNPPVLVPFWYIRALMLFIILSPVLLWIIRKFNYIFLILAFLVYYVVAPPHFYDLDFWIDEKWRSLWRFGISLEGLLYFSIGMTIGINKPLRISRLCGHVLGVVGICIGIIGVKSADLKMFSSIHWHSISIPLVLYSIWNLIPNVKMPDLWVCNTFGIFTLHFFVKYIFSVFTQCMSEIGPLYLIAQWVVTVICCIAIAHFTKKIFPATSRVVFGGR